jgi:hypothetical protein
MLLAWRILIIIQRNGSAVPSFCSSLLQPDAKTSCAEEESDIKWTATSMYSGWWLLFEDAFP